MKRRDFLKVASGAAGGAAAVGTATASSGSSRSLQEGNESDGDGSDGGGNGEGTDGEGEGGSEGGTEEVKVGPNNEFVFSPGTDEPLTISPGTTVNFVWESDTHNIVVESQPDEAEWEGHESIEDTGFEYEHTFEVEGSYEYYCEPHRGSGMVGTIEVGEGGGEGGPVKQDPHEMGVPFQAHFVGIATILMMFVSLVYTFFVLKYGESRHASAPNKR